MTWLGADELDLLVLGSGVAGLSAAVRAADELALRVGVLTKAELSQAATRWAQGGVAAVLGGDPDSTDLHLADTLAAGAGLCDVDAVRVLVDEGPGRVNELIAMGADVRPRPRGPAAAGPRGRALAAPASSTPAAPRPAPRSSGRWSTRCGRPRRRAGSSGSRFDLLVERRPLRGVVGHRRATATCTRSGPATSCWPPAAPGSCSPPPPTRSQSTGDGLAMALRAGVACADVEFMQFHPTALLSPRMPRPLLSEALRGHGALIRDLDGKRFVDELQPRDVVARAITAKMLEEDADHMLLDATGLERLRRALPDDRRRPAAAPGSIPPPTASRSRRPPTTTAAASSPTSTAPSALPGLWAAGEVACTGVHGANRLASQLAAGGHGVRARGSSRPSGAASTGPSRRAPCGRVLDEADPGPIAGRRLVASDLPAAPDPGRRRARRCGAASSGR